MGIYETLLERWNYAQAHDEPLYVSQAEVDKLRSTIGIDIDAAGTVHEVDAGKATSQAEAAADELP